MELAADEVCLSLLLLALAASAWLLLRSNRPVAYPGGPRPRRIHRVPEWSRGEDAASIPVEPGWKFLTAEESHRYTDAYVASNYGFAEKLTGESAGRQIWVYDADSTGQGAGDNSAAPAFDPTRNPNSSDLIYRHQQLSRPGISPSLASSGMPSTKEYADARMDESPSQAARDAAWKGLDFYGQLQCEDGHWAGDYGGPMFLMPGLVIATYAMHAMSIILPAPHRRAMATYMLNHQQADGGWGTHIESPSTMFGTVLNYVALRLLGGLDADDEAAKRAQRFIREQGGASYTSSWAKFWLCTIGLYDWKGINSIPPEMWTLPRWSPFHPGNFWCHCRMVYLPMCYLYGKRFVYADAEIDPLIAELRRELYPDQDYHTINWDHARPLVAEMDNYSPVGRLMTVLNWCLSWYEWIGACGPLRRRGLEIAIDYIHTEDAQTNYVDIGPVNKVMNMLCVFVDAGGELAAFKSSRALQQHVLRVPDYLWIAEDGMKMQGYNGSQCWDTSFIMRAMAEGSLAADFPTMVARAWGFLERTQILSTEVSQATDAYTYESVELRERYFRHVSKGGWPFSTSAHGWPISDCTAEGLKAVLSLRKIPFVRELIDAGRLPEVSPERLFDAVNVLLTYQNPDGGWATYENTRGYGWYEWLNPSEVFGDIMIDYSYVECSSASLAALAAFRSQFPTHRKEEVDQAIARGAQFVVSIQRRDGSWYGNWGCCFTYATWFGIEALVEAGFDPTTSVHVRKAVRFLLSHQNENGGWGEDFTSCYDKDYALDGAARFGNGGSGVVQTAWALLALVRAKCTDSEALARGAQYLISQQSSDGDWEQEGITGVFNRSCGITYTQYRNIFPIWALARYACSVETTHR